MKKNKGFPHSFQNTAPLLCSQIAISHIKNGATNTELEQGIKAKVLSSKSFLYYARANKEYTPINVCTPVASELEVHSLGLGGAA